MSQPGAPPSAAGAGAAAAPDGVVANTSRTVSLNCRMLANPAANATSAIGRSVVSMSSRAVCARWARARASGPTPSSADEQPVQLPLGVAEAGGEARDAGALHLAVGDQPHGAGDDVGAHVPLGRARDGVGPAAAAGAEARRAWAAAAVVKKETLRASGVRAGHDGRQ